MNFWDILIGVLLVAALLAALYFMNKSQGGCSGACDGCVFSDSCHSDKKKVK